ncbi:MAG: hypothetical protein LBL21_04810 [Rickettsiales bacterium]|jgi:hypothetical protein|nr:hypothetical protein [Rickettsiales bacterium]
MKKSSLFLLALLFVRPVVGAYTSPGSAIDNVQSYSSNPFYSIDGGYNQRFPTAVYAKGPQIGAAECQMVVDSAIWTQCSFRNNCQGLTANDIRPSVILELSTRTDANYADACKGYIDGAFSKYRQQVSGAVVSSNFPNATRPANYVQPQALENPFAYWNQVPEYEYQEKMREYQLENMQRQTGAPAQLAPTQMPSTFADLSFTERMDALREGWQAPGVNVRPTYNQLTVEKDVTMYKRQGDEAEARAKTAANRMTEEKNKANLLKETDIEAWCDKYPKECFGDKAYITYLEETNLDKLRARYPARADQKDERDALLANWSQEAAEAFCRKHPKDPICEQVWKDKQANDAELAAKATADAQANRDRLAREARLAEIEAREQQAARTESATTQADSEAEKAFLDAVIEALAR